MQILMFIMSHFVIFFQTYKQFWVDFKVFYLTLVHFTCFNKFNSHIGSAAKAKYTFDDDDMFGGKDDSFNANGKDDDDDDDWKKELSDDSDFEPTKSSQETKQ